MRVKIKAIKNDNGNYVMAADIRGIREYPQEGLEHKNRQSIYDDAHYMYSSSVWSYNEDDHTIEVN